MSDPLDPIERAVKAEQRFREVEATRSRFNPETGHHRSMGALGSEIPGASDLSAVPFPERLDPALALYGYKHHADTSKLAYRAGQDLNLSDRDLVLVKGAGMLHDLGRRIPWPAEDPGHQERGAAIAEEVMRQDPQFWGDREAREQVAWLIAHHDLSGPKPSDPRLIALWDAELFESMLLGVGSRAGAAGMSVALERVITPWARNPEHQLRWRSHHGW
jgi:hypothetical protein